MKIGDEVRYEPRDLADIHTPNTGVITHYRPGGTKASDWFNQPMAVITGTEGWIPASDLKPTNNNTETK